MKVGSVLVCVLSAAACASDAASGPLELSCAGALRSSSTLTIGGEDFTGRVAGAIVAEDQSYRIALHLTLDDEGAETLLRLTEALRHQQIVVAVEGEALFSPYVSQPVEGGEFVISGNFTFADLEAAAARLAPVCPDR